MAPQGISARPTATRAATLSLLLMLGACASARGRAPEAATPAHAESERRSRVARGDDDVAMRAERGSIDRDDAEAAIMSHWTRLTRCYRDGGDVTTFAEGSVTLQFEIALDGRTTAVHVQDSQLGNFAVERCLVESALAIRFARPHGNGRASFEYSMEFRSTDERPVIELPEESAALVRAPAQAAVAGACGASGLDAASATFYLDRRGRVHSAGLSTRHPLPAERARCVAETLAAATLPALTSLTGEALGRITVPLGESELRAAVAARAVASKPRTGKTRGKGRGKAAPADGSASDPLATTAQGRRTRPRR